MKFYEVGSMDMTKVAVIELLYTGDFWMVEQGKMFIN